MDDLKTLSGLRADAPEPDADRLRSLRARSTGRPRRFRFRFRLGPSLAAVATAAAVAVVAVNGTGWTGGRSAAPVSSPPVKVVPVEAGIVLERAALMAERRERAAEPRPDQWMYRKVAVKQPADTVNDVQEYWTRYDGTRQAFRQNGEEMDMRTIEPDPADDDLTPRQYAAKLADLPADPDRLLDHVRGDRHWATKPEGDPGAGEHPDARAFRVLSLYLGQEVAMPSDLEAAIFRALARIEGVRTTAGVLDALGRPGIGLTYEADVPGDGIQRDANGRAVTRSYVILDPTTYRYLGSRVDYLEDKMLGGELAFPKGSFYATAEVAAGVVDDPGQIP
ncbi:CU044_5270 family protein [Streptosporangium sp. NPDC002721]|uniref:CU044_5270 family protein n=1 Tax=Streptosporangium sp. NPDC002721 TaxID=3366188 RepID=UPI0036B91614